MNHDKHIITYPGFAESKEARGLYTDIQAAFPDYSCHILPFYEEEQGEDGRLTGNRIVHSVTKHAATIQEYMDRLDGEITMLAKCGGSRPTVAMDDEHIARLNKLCLVNPPWMVSNDFLKLQLAGWGATEHEDESWTLPRGRTGSYIITREYIKDVHMSDLMDRYRQIARSATKLFIVRALSDEMFRPIRVDEIPGALPIDIEGGDHHLTGDHRQKVIAALGSYSIL